MERLKQAVLKAAKIREDSWNGDTYEISMYEAADIAALECGYDKQATQPIYLLLSCSWNDAISWAKS